MKVWSTMYGEAYEVSDLGPVFSTKEKAEEWVKENRIDIKYDYVVIEEKVVDNE